MIPIHQKARAPWLDVGMCVGIWILAGYGLWNYQIGPSVGPQFLDLLLIGTLWVWGALLLARTAPLVSRLSDHDWRSELAVTMVTAPEFLRRTLDHRVLLTLTWASTVPMQSAMLSQVLLRDDPGELGVLGAFLFGGTAGWLLAVAGTYESLRLQCRHERQKSLWVVVPSIAAAACIVWPIGALWLLEKANPSRGGAAAIFAGAFLVCAVLAWHRRRAAIRDYLRME